MRPRAEIAAPPFPRGLPWVNVAPLRMDQQIGRPVLVEFWDFCRVNSLRTLPYVQEWLRRYGEQGLRVIGVHCAGFPPSAAEAAVREAVRRLEIRHPVAIDLDFAVWREYGNDGWPARYLWDQRGLLHHHHYGEGGYVETERAIQELLAVEREPVTPLRPEDEPGAVLVAQTPDREGAYSGPYAAGAAWAVLDGNGTVRVGEREFAVNGPGCYPLVEHTCHTEATLDLDVGAGVTCHAVCFTPGLEGQPASA